ncbi:MAG TPA: hypothetical protein PK530_03575 [Anaerolineales bacterium]|nr:hypothetical protein [Anaerolineales bacterium]
MMNTLEQALNTQRQVASFLLRFTQDMWQDENGEPKVQWRGNIHHVQGDEEIPFTDFTEALLFMQKQLQDLTLQAFPTADVQMQEKMLAESFKLWEQFAANYSKMLFQAMEQTIQRSQEIPHQVGDAFTKAFEVWMPPVFRSEKTKGAEPVRDQAPAEAGVSPELVQQLATLTAQVQALSAKIETLEKSEK